MVIEKDGKDVIDHDEIRQFVDMRYVSPHEGFWRYAVLKLCGKTSIISTKQSALMRVFFTNAEKVYRLVIWKDKIDEVYDKLKIGNVIKLTSLKATSFFKTENDIFPSNLNVNFDLVYTSTSTMSVLKKGTFEEYPSLNPYPPFWKEISGLIRSDEEIVMRVVLIGSFTADQLKIGEVEHEGFSAFVGDKSHKKVFIFVVKTSEIDDQDFVDSLVKNTEFYVSGAKAIEKYRQPYWCLRLIMLVVRSPAKSNNSSVDLSFSPSQGKQNFSERLTLSASRFAVSLTIPTTAVDTKNLGNSSWKGLTPGEPYLLRLTANNAAGDSYADYMFCIHAPPSASKLMVIPNKDIAALQTPVRISPVGIEGEGLSMCQMKYGIKTLLVGNHSRIEWSRSTVTDFYEILLPSAWPEPHAACGQRIGYQAVLEICDAWNACSLQESDTFVVDLALNSSGVLTQALSLIQSRLANGDVYNAIELCASVIEEKCGSSLSSNKDLIDSVIDKLIDLLDDTNDSDELLEGLDYAMKVVGFASPLAMDRVMQLVDRVKQSVGMPSSSNTSSLSITAITGFPRGRNKRSVNLMSTLTAAADKEVNEAAASTLLVAYDLLVGKNQDVVRVYLNNLQDILSDFCIQADDSRVLSASGRTYTELQSQGVTPGATSFLNSSFTVAATKLYLISFDSGFAEAFSNWPCMNGTSCNVICLGTAQTLLSALRDNQYLASYFFSSQYNSVSLDQVVSDFYHVYLLDPVSGSMQTLKAGAGYTVRLPISKYVASAYYKCFVFTGTIWEDNSACKSANYPNLMGKTSSGSFQLACHCYKTGVISVFTISPPTPIPYPLYNEVLLFFYLNTNILPAGPQLNTFLDYLSSASGVDSQRFAGVNCSISVNNQTSVAVITVKLRPPFRDGQQTTSYAMQSIRRTVHIDGGFTAYESVKVTNMGDTVVYRELMGDKNARRITLRIDRSFKEVVGNDAEGVASKWASRMAKNMRISEYRIKNSVVLTGILFNFTITVPFDGESVYNSSILSAEEISKWIQEQVKYCEMDLTDSREQILPVDMLTNADIIELRVLQETSTLMVCLAILVPTAFVLVTFCAGGLVFMKIRTDKLIESHNANMTTIDISQTTPINVMPFQSEMDHQTNRVSDTNASDTVVFGRRRTGNRSRNRRK
uniref:PKD/REJ-like domain-containing protein n=1 Tax=Ditylenchus dipsaci TaxID=166011 RepID=A0A915DSH7_9BILA